MIADPSPVAGSLHVVCPNCSTTNRVAHDRLGEARCGHCKEALFSGHPFELDKSDFSRHVNGDVPLVVDF